MGIKDLYLEAEKNGVELYKRTVDEDWLLLKWYMRLKEADEMEVMFGPGIQTLGTLMAHFQRPDVILMYAGDMEGNVVTAAWCESIYPQGANFSVWIDEKHRQAKSTFKHMQYIYTLAKKAFPILVGYTREELLDEHRKIGYDVCGSIPDIIREGETVQVVYLTNEGFAKSPLNLEGGG